MTGRHPSHVTEPTGRQAEQRRVRGGGVGGEVHQRRGRQVRRVRDQRHELVMALGREGDRVGTEEPHKGLDLRICVRRSVLPGREHPRGTEEQVRVCAVNAFLF